ncbi:MAG: transglutaminase-like domain-containing protein [Firmicutes bacterium]|nr:transglutaminase-like domain-containing protein [Bacillota bacterium]MCM1400696.1 transglutaminase-like domain-containing protein [Bacteroides sp.]MCM1476390.1 transglutaminase-like domain-containing protein [Bacteroides sp.]
MKRVTLLVLCAASICSAQSQTGSSYADFKKDLHKEYDNFLRDAKNDYASFRDKVNREYATFLADSNWVPSKPDAPVQKPIDRSVAPRPLTPLPQSAPMPQSRPLPIDNVVSPPPVPDAPVPSEPFDYKGRPGQVAERSVKLFGTDFNVNVANDHSISLGRLDHASIGKAWQTLSSRQSLDATIGSLLRLRDDRDLCDWAYYCLVRETGAMLHGAGSNEEALFTAYVMNQSGYTTRLALDAPAGRLYAMPGTENLIFDQPYFPVGDVKFYPFAKLGSVQMVSADYPGTRPLSMLVDKLPRLANRPTAAKSLTVKHYPEVKIDYECNANLLEFFNGYPASALPGNSRTKWAYYAVTPLSEPIRKAIYPTLKKALEGKSQRDAANLLMDFCESFPYAPDNDVWGYDRAYFADETLNYQNGDCEDHAILFVRLVRDLMGLDVALIYFPNHLAAAVAFTDDVPGDYINYNSRRWTVCDPTIFYSGVGHIMDGCDPTKASLIPLSGLR